MFTRPCAKHSNESVEWYKQDRIENPDSEEQDRIGRRLIKVATEDINTSCSNPPCQVLSEIVF